MAMAKRIGSVAAYNIKSVMMRSLSSAAERGSRYHGVKDGAASNGRPRGTCGYIPPPMPSWAEKYEKAKALNSHVYTYHHWLIALKPLRGRPSTDEIMHYYVKTLSKLVRNRDEAIKKIYSAATAKGYAFCANIPPDQADLLEEFKNVVDVSPDDVSPDKRDPSGEPLPLDTKHYPNLPLESLADDEWRRLRQSPRFPSEYAKA